MLGKLVSKIGRAVTACDTSNEPDEATLPLDFVTTVHMKEIVRDYNFNRFNHCFTVNFPKLFLHSIKLKLKRIEAVFK